MLGSVQQNLLDHTGSCHVTCFHVGAGEHVEMPGSLLKRLSCTLDGKLVSSYVWCSFKTLVRVGGEGWEQQRGDRDETRSGRLWEAADFVPRARCSSWAVVASACPSLQVRGARSAERARVAARLYLLHASAAFLEPWPIVASAALGLSRVAAPGCPAAGVVVFKRAETARAAHSDRN